MPTAAQIRETERRLEIKERKDAERRYADEDFVRLMGEEWGRRIVWRLLEATDNRQQLFATNHTVCVHNASLRDFGKAEFTDRALQLCPELYLTMIRENR